MARTPVSTERGAGQVGPVLARIETRARHGAGKPTGRTIKELADGLGFLVKVLGVTVTERLAESPAS